MKKFILLTLLIVGCDNSTEIAELRKRIEYIEKDSVQETEESMDKESFIQKRIAEKDLPSWDIPAFKTLSEIEWERINDEGVCIRIYFPTKKPSYSCHTSYTQFECLTKDNHKNLRSWWYNLHEGSTPKETCKAFCDFMTIKYGEARYSNSYSDCK